MNPFASRFLRPGAIPFLFPEGRSLSQLVAQLAGQDGWGQIVGPHGSGKSTLLAALVDALRASGCRLVVHTLRRGQRRPAAWPPPPDTQQLVIDGYEQLSWGWRWRIKAWCRRHGCGLLVTTHRDLGLPTLWTTTTDLPTLRKVVDHLLQHASPPTAKAAGPDQAPFSEQELAAALTAAGGNLREALFRLYDLYPQRTLASAARADLRAGK